MDRISVGGVIAQQLGLQPLALEVVLRLGSEGMLGGEFVQPIGELADQHPEVLPLCFEALQSGTVGGRAGFLSGVPGGKNLVVPVALAHADFARWAPDGMPVHGVVVPERLIFVGVVPRGGAAERAWQHFK